ncbi:MAG: exodeoxyribonuclease VII small subunit [Bacteroidales bacterium]|nr:exodeoxyribonuclease VII small subunit [Bacteroidales bacterium]
MAVKKMSYADAFGELQEILKQIEDGGADVDKLTERVKRASELIKICKTKLYETESEVGKILDDLDNE